MSESSDLVGSLALALCKAYIVVAHLGRVHRRSISVLRVTSYMRAI